MMDVECWAVWRDGSKTFLVGRLNPKDPEKRSSAGEDSYRCFVSSIGPYVVMYCKSKVNIKMSHQTDQYVYKKDRSYEAIWVSSVEGQNPERVA